MDKRLIPFLFVCLVFSGCDSVDTTPGAARVSVKFQTSQTAPAPAAKGESALDGSLMITRDNGTLELTDIRLIVAELELDRSGHDCQGEHDGEHGEDDEGEHEDDDGQDDDGDHEEDHDEHCGDFETDPFFLALPLDGSEVTVSTSEVPPGSYRGLEFEVENLETDSDDDDRKQQEIQALLGEIRADPAFADWPARASMVAVGAFTPAGSAEPVPFKVYFDAEIEIEIEFAEALTVTEEDGSSISVQVSLESWFATEHSVRDLSQDNYDPDEGNLVEFELEIERGFHSVEFEHEHGDHDDDEHDDD